jgi:type II secretory pathway pseudopilin PulG
MPLDRRRPAARRTGFTLVEVLVAAGLCLLIMTVLATCFQAGMDTLSQLKSLGDLQQQLRTADVLLRRDLQAQHLESRFGNRVSDQRLDLYQPYNPYTIDPTTGRLNGPNPSPYGSPPAWQPPDAGFFRIFQGIDSAATVAGGTGVTVNEGTDPDNLPATRATTHILHMAVKVPADRLDRVFTATVPSGVWTALSPFATARALPPTNPAASPEFGFPGEWAEVAYFLDTPQPLTTPSTLGTQRTGQSNGMTLLTLYRKVRLLGNGNPQAAGFTRTTLAAATAPIIPWKYQGLSFNPTTFTPIGGTVANRPADLLNSPMSIAGPYQRLGGILSSRTASGVVPALGSPLETNAPNTIASTGGGQFDAVGFERDAAGNPTATDVVLNNVISFEVRATWDVNPNRDFRYMEAMGVPPPTPASPVPQSVGVPLTAQLPGWSGRADGVFDDLPPVPTLPPPQGAVTGNPLFDRAQATPPTLPRVFDTWAGNNLLPMGQLVPAGGSPTHQYRVDWDRPVADCMPRGTPPNTQTVPTAMGGPLLPNPNCVPLFIRVKAVQIKIRVWDPKNKVARQITLIEPV